LPAADSPTVNVPLALMAGKRGASGLFGSGVLLPSPVGVGVGVPLGSSSPPHAAMIPNTIMSASDSAMIFASFFFIFR